MDRICFLKFYRSAKDKQGNCTTYETDTRILSSNNMKKKLKKNDWLPKCKSDLKSFTFLCL